MVVAQVIDGGSPGGRGRGPQVAKGIAVMGNWRFGVGVATQVNVPMVLWGLLAEAHGEMTGREGHLGYLSVGVAGSH